MSEISSSFTPRIATALILTGESGVSSAAMTASQTFWKWLRRVMKANFSGWSVSSECSRGRGRLDEALQVLL